MYTMDLSLTAAHCVLLLPGQPVTLSTDEGASLLYAEVPDAGRLDSGFSTNRPFFTFLDWTRTVVIKSQSDGRKRIELVSPDLSNTAAIRIQMVVYPPGSGAASYHHEGAESSVYVLSGGGKCCANGQSFPVRQGDVIYFADREPHFLNASPDSELRFLVFYAPGVFKTISADPSKVSAWASTGRDINGLAPLGSDAGRRGTGWFLP